MKELALAVEAVHFGKITQELADTLLRIIDEQREESDFVQECIGDAIEQLEAGNVGNAKRELARLVKRREDLGE